MSIILSSFLTYRYLLRHTHWQGAAGTIPGSPWKHVRRILLPELSTGFTAGWSAPWRFMRRFNRLLDGAKLAGHPVRFQRSSRKLYRHFAITWVAIVSLVAVVNVAGNGLDPESAVFGVQVTALVACSNVLKDGGDDVGVFDTGDHAQRAAALGAGLDVNRE